MADAQEQQSAIGKRNAEMLEVAATSRQRKPMSRPLMIMNVGDATIPMVRSTVGVTLS